jgi:mRNA interferase RelE/StbE
MIVQIDESFVKDTNKLKDRKIRLQLAEVIEEVGAAASVGAIPNLKKLVGEKNHYRIRLGHYRIGLYIKADTVTFIRFLHRKEIYRLFP